MPLGYSKTQTSRRSSGLSCEQLESRDVPATLVVDSLLDTALADVPAQPEGQPGGAVIIRETTTSTSVEEPTAQPPPPPQPVPSLQYLTLRAAIELSERFDFMGPDTITFSNGILVQGQQVKIDLTRELLKWNGNEALAITGPGADKFALNIAPGITSRLLNYAGGNALCVSGLTFKNGTALPPAQLPAVQNEGGGAICQKGNFLNVSACKFVSNTAQGNHGGAIAAYSGSLVVTDSTFELNTAGGHGGAIAQLEMAIVTISKCEFTKNETTGPAGSGGALYVIKGSELRVSDSKFDQNKATADGGAILYSCPAAPEEGKPRFKFTFLSSQLFASKLTKNEGKNGGAIAVIGDSYDFVTHGIEVKENKGLVQGGAYYLSGGGSAATFKDQLSTFSNNETVGKVVTSNRGGAIMLSTLFDTTFDHTTFSDNKSGAGGAVFADQKYTTFKSCTFSGNQAEQGAKLCYLGSLTVPMGEPNWVRFDIQNCTDFDATDAIKYQAPE
jgi:hypothetical protein